VWAKRAGLSSSKSHRATEKEKRVALDLLAKGVHVAEVARKVGFLDGSVRIWAEKAGVAWQHYKPPDSNTPVGVENRVVELLVGGSTINATSQEVGVAKSTVVAIAKRRGLKRLEWGGKWAKKKV
jgi:transposase-like protein